LKIDKNILIIIMIIVPVLITGTVNHLFSAENGVNVKITSQFSVNYCKNKLPKKQLLITIGVGDVKSIDSLYGFNFAMKYDTSKVKFNGKIVINTLAEFSDFNDLSFNLEPGKVMGYVLNNHPLVGNKELIGFVGEYIGPMCDDSALLEIEYIEFTDDYKKEILSIDNTWIKAVKYEYTDAKININLPEKPIIYNLDSKNIITTNLSLNRLQYFDDIYLKMYFTSNNYKIDSIFNNNDIFEVKSIEYLNNQNTSIVKLKNSKDTLRDEHILNVISYTKLANETDTTTKFIIEPLNLSNCNCTIYENMKGDTVELFYKKADTSTSVENVDSNIQIVYRNGMLSITNNSIVSTNAIRLFNYEGFEVFSTQLVNSNFKDFELELQNGVYYAVLYTSNNVIKKKIFINN